MNFWALTLSINGLVLCAAGLVKTDRRKDYWDWFFNAFMLGIYSAILVRELCKLKP